jgi:CheY-like chemotaxis protein
VDEGLAGVAGIAPAVLVVEDDEATRSLLREVLAGQGYSVLEAVDGETALQVARTAPLSLILLDLHLPRLNGCDFARAYLTQPWPRAPVVVVTADAAALGNAAMAEIGAAAVLVKPFALAELLTLIHRLTAPEKGVSQEPTPPPGTASAPGRCHDGRMPASERC